MEQAFLETPVATAFNNWMKITGPIIELTGAIYRAFDVVAINVPAQNQMYKFMGKEETDVTIEVAQRHNDTNHEALHSLLLLADWGAFEAFVEDMVKAVFEMEPQWLDNPRLDTAKGRAVRDGLDGVAADEYVAKAAVDMDRSPIQLNGEGKFEQQLAWVGLDGNIPPDLAEILSQTQAIRNAWAHCGGRADKKFVNRETNLNYQIGERIPIDQERATEFVVALNVYAMIILDRWRVRSGYPAIQCYQGPKNPFKAGFDQLFPGAISPESLLDTLPSE